MEQNLGETMIVFVYQLVTAVSQYDRPPTLQEFGVTHKLDGWDFLKMYIKSAWVSQHERYQSDIEGGITYLLALWLASCYSNS